MAEVLLWNSVEEAKILSPEKSKLLKKVDGSVDGVWSEKRPWLREEVGCGVRECMGGRRCEMRGGGGMEMRWLVGENAP